jgi:hypothetical protein
MKFLSVISRSLFCIVLSGATCLSASGADGSLTEKKPITVTTLARGEAQNMKIRLTINGKTLTATLYDTSSARDFVAQLPLTLTFEDYAATEKVAYLPRKLSTAGAPTGFDPSAGDITYYAPWGNLAIFHKDFSYSSGLISLGRLESGTEILEVPGSMKVMIEFADK